MSYWRKLFIVVLLALSLPVQSFAAISMKCVATYGDASEAHAPRAQEAASAHHSRVKHGIALADDDHHHRYHGDAHQAHSCSTCTSCCFGAGLPTVPAVAVSADVRRAIVSFPPSAGVVSFLTDGIERPPRRFPV
ncbi:hypothetical protein C0Z18_12690 [Trinickia dabaoshanensis]|uniref:DUF2946 domain-containing protein n=1 Tax=Trinickia dabaoshanensis TaxID=564714 RepID=A0A2N7VRN2_9BURK|nr:hypothetical protein [Trinickia dabaoshanensis]PMS19824.1 hypothetical protein C0Z18_12690 [Trinickia dabaoshanensis]TAM50911.1 MAG: hypothetical protein EPN57_19785 [Paraburkholderia sp.]